MKKLTVMAAGLGWRTLERSGRTDLAGLKFEPRPSVFPAVTCVAQATLRTGLPPFEHGMISNGWWSEILRKPLFWEQSAKLINGQRIWEPETINPTPETRNPKPETLNSSTGLFFFQQSLGESVDLLISPAPIHKHGGGMVMSCYTKPTELATELERRHGKFPLWRYWGPLASPKVGRRCIDWFASATEIHDVDEAYLYLPTLDYAAQKYGPGSPQDQAAFAEFSHQVETLVTLCEKRGCGLSIVGDYEITPVTSAPVRPNVALRAAGLFRTRIVGGRAYPDFYQSSAFAMCDHEFCVIYGEARAKAVEWLLATGDYECATTPPTLQSSNHPTILLAKCGSWCEYKWWTNNREAPDYASHVDIHNKPGYDPTELFFFGRGTVQGTHGRQCEVASSRRVAFKNCRTVAKGVSGASSSGGRPTSCAY